jgi:hypothetical protein
LTLLAFLALLAFSSAPAALATAIAFDVAAIALRRAFVRPGERTDGEERHGGRGEGADGRSAASATGCRALAELRRLFRAHCDGRVDRRFGSVLE